MRPVSSWPIAHLVLPAVALVALVSVILPAPASAAGLARGSGFGGAAAAPARSARLGRRAVGRIGPGRFGDPEYGGSGYPRRDSAGHGFGGGGYGSYGFAGGSSGLPLTGATVTAGFGEPLDPGLLVPGGARGPVFFGHPPGLPSLPGIAPSPVKPPAIYVVEGGRRAGRVRASRRPGSAALDGAPENGAGLPAPVLLEVRSGRS